MQPQLKLYLLGVLRVNNKQGQAEQGRGNLCRHRCYCAREDGEGREAHSKGLSTKDVCIEGWEGLAKLAEWESWTRLLAQHCKQIKTDQKSP